MCWRRIHVARVEARARGVAVLGVGVGLDFGERAPEPPAGVVAAGVVPVHDEVRVAADRLARGVVAVPAVLVDAQPLRGADGNLFGGDDVAAVVMGVLGQAADGLQRDGRENQRVSGAEDDHRRQKGHHAVPAASVQPRPAIGFCLGEKRSFHSCITSCPNPPNPASGQTRKTILPTICSSDTQPILLCRESTEVERWSPRQKYRLSGT